MAHDCRTFPWYPHADALIALLDLQKSQNGGQNGWATLYWDFEAYAALVLLQDHLSVALGDPPPQAPAPWQGGSFEPGNVQFLAEVGVEGLILDRDDPNWHVPGSGWLDTSPSPNGKGDPVALQKARDLIQRIRDSLDIV